MLQVNYNYYCLSDPRDTLKAVKSKMSLPYADDQLVDHRRPRDVKMRRGSEHRRVKEDYREQNHSYSSRIER